MLAGTTSNKDVYKFSVTADAAGPIALYKVSFLVTTSTATATNWYLFEGGSQVAATTTVATSTVDGSGDHGDTSGVAIVNLVFTDDGEAPSAGGADIMPQTISAGTTKTYTLRLGSLEGPSGTTSGSIQIQFLGDSVAPTATNPNTALALDVPASIFENSFIWSDLWRTFDTASGTASNTQQWTNGYKVPTGASSKLQSTSTAVTFSK
jgi:hypothetical protein